MADTLTVRVYNVHFGDAILVTVPDRDPATDKVTKRRILIDVGNVATATSATGGDDRLFGPVVEDILEQLDGKPLDLYVMTHEHLDHVQGLPYAAWKLYRDRFAQRFKVGSAWFTASSAKDYYARHPAAQKKKLEFDEMYRRIRAYLSVSEPTGLAAYAPYLAVNDPSKTGECVEFLRGLAPEHTAYVYRGAPLAGTHPFQEAKLEIWAPEEDTSSYYERLLPFSAAGDDAGPALAGPATVARPAPALVPPPGVDVGAFFQLVEARRNGIGDNLLAIDKAANNTSLVFLLRWRGWKLLFAGDAELKSWRTMQARQVLEPVHFLKVAHHGSRNGTPSGAIFDAILPPQPPDRRKRTAAISAWDHTYSGIPDPATNARLEGRAELHRTLQSREKLYFDLEFRDPGRST